MEQNTSVWPDLHAPQDAETAPAPRGRRRRLASTTPGSIPIVGGAHEVVGWTERAPVIENGRLRHAEAERVLGGPIFCTQVALTSPAEIARAGGPANWTGPWRCLALCPIAHARGLEQPHEFPAGDALAGPAPGDPPRLAPI
jgi:hypothetical protein